MVNAKRKGPVLGPWKGDVLHERLERALESSRSWPKHVWAENLKYLNRYLKDLREL